MRRRWPRPACVSGGCDPPVNTASADSRPLVVHLVHRFSVGGLENGVVNLINGLSAERWRHAVVALTEVDAVFARRIKRTDVRCLSLHKSPGQGLWLYPKLYRMFRAMKPAVVHTRNLGTLEYQIPAWLAGVPGRIHGEHGRDIDDVHGTSRRNKLLRRIYRPWAQHQIALGAELTQYLRAEVGVAHDRLHTVYNGVDHLRFAPRGQRAPLAGSPFNDPALWVLGTVGRLQPVKAQTDLVHAFILLLQAQPALRARVRLVLVGDGALRQACEDMLKQAGLEALAWMAGERADVPDVMRSLDCFVLPSLAEGISNTILEAMASGLPVIATAVGANAELVTAGVTGLLVPAADPQRLAEAMAHMANDSVAAAAMGRQGRLTVEQRFSLPNMLATYESLYERLLPGRLKE